MSKNLEPEQAIRHIFSTQYITDELGHDWVKEIPQMAELSAQKLYSYVGQKRVKEVLSLLKEMRDNFEHPLILDAELSCWVDWEEEPGQWADFQMLLDEIIKNLPSS
jgi:pentatricopeptide repeat protein